MDITFNAETTLKISAGEVHLLLDIARMSYGEAQRQFACGRISKTRNEDIKGLCMEIIIGLEGSG